MNHDDTVDEYIREIEHCLSQFEALKHEEQAITAELRRAEQAGELDTCRLCGRKWIELRRMARQLNAQVERTIMFRLPPTLAAPRIVADGALSA